VNSPATAAAMSAPFVLMVLSLMWLKLAGRLLSPSGRACAHWYGPR